MRKGSKFPHTNLDRNRLSVRGGGTRKRRKTLHHIIIIKLRRERERWWPGQARKCSKITHLVLILVCPSSHFLLTLHLCHNNSHCKYTPPCLVRCCAACISVPAPPPPISFSLTHHPNPPRFIRAVWSCLAYLPWEMVPLCKKRCCHLLHFLKPGTGRRYIDKTEGTDRDRIRIGRKRDRGFEVVLSPNRQPTDRKHA
jgi:hypothetical protein